MAVCLVRQSAKRIQAKVEALVSRFTYTLAALRLSYLVFLAPASASVFLASILVRTLASFLVFFTPAALRAQMDLSSALLLEQSQVGHQAQTIPAGPNSRYTVRPKNIEKRQVKVENSSGDISANSSTANGNSTSGNSLPSSSSANNSVGLGGEGLSDPTSTPVGVAASPLGFPNLANDTKSASAPTDRLSGSSGSKSSARHSVSKSSDDAGDTNSLRRKLLEEGRVLAANSDLPAPVVQIPTDDRRLNSLEILVSPGFLYSASASNYSYRQYTINSPLVSGAASIWLSHDWGVQLAMATTLSAHMSDRPEGERNTTVTSTWTSAGFRNRRFFGFTRLAPSLTLGFDYFEYQVKVPQTSIYRAKLTSAGLKVSVDGELPSSALQSWLIGMSLSPKSSHREDPASYNFSSGPGVDSHTVGASIGLKFNFDRGNAFVFKLSHEVETDQFSGDATRPDQNNGVTPSSVSVLQSNTILSLGYLWGH
jgi:hypothetical protein